MARHAGSKPDDPRRRKWVNYQKTQGVFPYADATPVHEHLAHLLTRLSKAEIARRAGLPIGTVRVHTAGGCQQSRMIRPDNADAILGVRIGPDDFTPLERSTGGIRMYRGMVCLGWTARVLGEIVGVNYSSTSSTLINMNRGDFSPLPRLYSALMEACQKLETTDPLDHGIELKVKNRNISWARNNGWYSITAWDYDTVHLPDAFPDTTGACGSIEGYRIHRKYDTPVCGPCKLGRKTWRVEVGERNEVDD